MCAYLRLPQTITKAGRILNRNGKQAFLVGGAIRDLLLSMAPQDWDLATDALPEETSRFFLKAGYRVIPSGIKYGTVKVLFGPQALEITTFRTEGKYHDYRHPDTVFFTDEVVADLARRDFTINALAYNLTTGLLQDPFAGLRDLAGQQIRAVGCPSERFREDPLRMLRAVRLAAQLGFAIHPDTYLSIAVNGFLIKKVANERILEEFQKILMAPHVVKGLELLRDSSLLFLIIPELGPAWWWGSSSMSTLSHLLETVRYVPPKPALRLAALLHDLGQFDEAARFCACDHALYGAEMSRRILWRLRYPKKIIDEVYLLIREHEFSITMTVSEMRQFLARVGTDRAKDLQALRRADILAAGTASGVSEAMGGFCSWYQVFSRVVREGVLPQAALAVNGRDVMSILQINPGPTVGVVLNRLYAEVLENPQRNCRDYLLDRIRRMALADCKLK